MGASPGLPSPSTPSPGTVVKKTEQVAQIVKAIQPRHPFLSAPVEGLSLLEQGLMLVLLRTLTEELDLTTLLITHEMDVVKRATEAVGEYGTRVSLVLKADIRPGYTGQLTAKVQRIEDALG